MRKNNKLKTLSLNTLTIRAIQGAQLGDVAGGLFPSERCKIPTSPLATCPPKTHTM